jgi:hypothetical protein
VAQQGRDLLPCESPGHPDGDQGLEIGRSVTVPLSRYFTRGINETREGQRLGQTNVTVLPERVASQNRDKNPNDAQSK